MALGIGSLSKLTSEVGSSIGNTVGGSSYDGYINKVELSLSNAEVKIDGARWFSEEFFITDVYTDISTDFKAGTCEIIFTQPNSNYNLNQFDVSGDFAAIKVGVPLEVKLGYEKNLETVFVGFISSFDVRIRNQAEAVVTIHGMDGKMWLMSGKTTVEHKDKTSYSKIVSQVFSNYSGKFEGNSIKITGEEEFLTQIYQRLESDYEVICRAATKVGALFFVDQTGKFHFVSPTVNKNSEFNITPSLGFQNIRSSVDVWGIPKEVVVKGIDPEDSTKVLTGKATSSEGVGDGKTASSATSNINNTFTLIDNALASKATADFLAKAILTIKNLGLIKTTVEILGTPTIKLGKGATVDKFGDPMDNDYLVTGIKHEYHCDPNRGHNYKTYLSLSASKFKPKEKGLDMLKKIF